MKLSNCRSQILDLITDRELTVAQLADRTARLQTNVSRDLRFLREAGLVVSRRDGMNVFYRAVRTGTSR